jgi:glycosyltransferase involved in cell wall biosynthesis
MKNPRIIVYTSGYNASAWAEKCIKSVQSQTYQNYIHIVVDDASTDNTFQICEKFRSDKMLLKKNSKNLKWLNTAALHLKPEPNDIVATLDLDDWLANSSVLQTVVDLYTKNNCWLTYGDYVRLSRPGSTGSNHCRPFSAEILSGRKFRSHSFITSHLRTFKGFLWNNIKQSDFLIWDGSWADMAYDCAIMYPMLDMCKPGKIICCPQVLYVYNDGNPLNDHKRDVGLQQRTDKWFRQKPRYQVLTDYD